MAFDMGIGVPDGGSTTHGTAKENMADHGMAEISRLSLGQQDDEPQRNSAPRLDYPGVIAEDITQKFAQATRGE